MPSSVPSSNFVSDTVLQRIELTGVQNYLDLKSRMRSKASKCKELPALEQLQIAILPSRDGDPLVVYDDATLTEQVRKIPGDKVYCSLYCPATQKLLQEEVLIAKELRKELSDVIRSHSKSNAEEKAESFFTRIKNVISRHPKLAATIGICAVAAAACFYPVATLIAAGAAAIYAFRNYLQSFLLKLKDALVAVGEWVWNHVKTWYDKFSNGIAAVTRWIF